MKRLINAAFTAALSGGAAAVAQFSLDPDHFDWKHTGSVFLAGAVIGLLNWIRRAPWEKEPAQLVQAAKSGQ